VKVISQQKPIKVVTCISYYHEVVENNEFEFASICHQRVETFCYSSFKKRKSISSFSISSIINELLLKMYELKRYER
jgi:hypothetical protein